MMPVPVRKRSEEEWQALKNHIIKERQRKKQEQEADAEVQRQRLELEQKQKQDVMTLGETREQISVLETRLAALNEEKHQLFLRLKKVLNEDDNRRRQYVVKEPNNTEQAGAGTAQGGGPTGVPQQPLPGRTPLYNVAGTAPGNSAPPVSTKRVRTPSPPPSQGPGYHPYGYKSQGFQHKPEDGRRGHEYVRAVLWNKGTTATYGGVYGVTPNQPVYSYSGAPAQYEPVYLPRQPAYENKPESDKMYLRGPAAPLSIPVHPPQASKAGGITSGFPVRPPHQSHNVYLGQSSSGRLLYSGAPTANPGNRYPGAGTM